MKTFYFFTFSSFVFLFPFFSSALEPNCGAVVAISGGSNPAANHLRYYQVLDKVQEAFAGCPIANFVASGKETDKVSLSYEEMGERMVNGQSEPIKRILLDDRGLPILRTRIPQGGIQGAASHEDIKQGLQLAVQQAKVHPILFYVTDHGLFAHGQGEIKLWGSHTMDKEDLQKILHEAAPRADQKIILLFDQCHGGSLLQSIWDQHGHIPQHPICGISASDIGEVSHDTGGIMRNLHQMMTNDPEGEGLTYDDLYQQLLKDRRVKSHPLRSSDLYALDWIKRKKEKANQVTLPELGAQLFHHLLGPRPSCLGQEDRAHSPLPSEKFSSASFSLAYQQRREKLLDEFQEEIGTPPVFPLEDALLQKMKKDLKEKEEAYQEAQKAHQEFLRNKFNPHLLQLAEKYYPAFPQYLKLKDKMNQGQSFSPEEEKEMQNYSKELELFHAGILDEAGLRLEKVKAPFQYPSNLETQIMVADKTRWLSQRVEKMGEFHQARKKFLNLSVLKALDEMRETADQEAISNYLKLVDCEHTKIFLTGRKSP